MKKFNLYSLLAILSVSVIVGCGGGSSDPIPTPISIPTTLDIGTVTYHVPSGAKVVEANISGTTAKMLSSGDTSQVSGFIQQIATTTPTKNSTFFARVQGTLTEAEVALHDASYTSSVTMLTTQSFSTPYQFTIAQYRLETDSLKPLDLAGKVLNTLAGDGVTGLPVADANSTEDTTFRLVLLYANYEGTTFYIAVVVPESQYNQFEVMINAILNASNMTQEGASLQSATQNFTYSTGSGKADFLFVVDDSGSMGNDQVALAKAAKDFTSEMNNSGVVYRSAIITTGVDADNNESTSYMNAYRILSEHGIIENNNTLLERLLVAGDNGSGIETGIWNAEQALLSVEHGDSKNGGVTALGMPERNASLSVIIISDEPSQYTSRSSTGDFNVSKNLFKDRNITVYAIIKPGYSYSTTRIFDEDNRSQYDNLVLETKGIYADIGNTDSNGALDFSFIMKQIAKDVGGASSSFILANPSAAITEVKVNGNVVVADTVNGYTYLQSSNAIVFHGTAIPPNGATIMVTYNY